MRIKYLQNVRDDFLHDTSLETAALESTKQPSVSFSKYNISTLCKHYLLQSISNSFQVSQDDDDDDKSCLNSQKRKSSKDDDSEKLQPIAKRSTNFVRI